MDLYHATNLLTALGLATHKYVQTEPHKLISGIPSISLCHLNILFQYAWGLSLNLYLFSHIHHLHNQSVWVTCGLRSIINHASIYKLGLNSVDASGFVNV